MCWDIVLDNYSHFEKAQDRLGNLINTERFVGEKLFTLSSGPIVVQALTITLNMIFYQMKYALLQSNNQTVVLLI